MTANETYEGSSHPQTSTLGRTWYKHRLHCRLFLMGFPVNVSDSSVDFWSSRPRAFLLSLRVTTADDHIKTILPLQVKQS